MHESTFLERLRGPAVNAPDDLPPLDDDIARLRVPPQSREAEQSLLGGLLVDASAFSRATEIVRPADFYAHAHRLIFEAIGTLVATGTAVDVITTFEQLEREGRAVDAGGLVYLNSLVQSVPSAAAVARYAEIIAERAVLRRIIALTDDLAVKAFRNEPSGLLLDDAKLELTRLADARAAGAGRLPLYTLAELREHSHSAAWVVKHVLPADSIGMLYGGTGTFKTFVALDCALHVAHGLKWMGRRTVQGSVVYLAAEGKAGIWPRICAWHRARRLPWANAPLTVMPVSVDLRADAWRVVESVQAKDIGAPALVVIDTLSQTYTGEENSAAEVASYFREIGRRMRDLWRCAVLILHHTGHTATERPRGSSAMPANLDFMFGAFRDATEMLATLTCGKQKDGEKFRDATFAITSEKLDVDADGDDITSLVARHLSSAEDVQQAMEFESKAGRGGNNHLLVSLLQNGQKESELREIFYRQVGLDDAAARRQAYFRARAWAIKGGHMEVAEGYVLTLKKSTGPP